MVKFLTARGCNGVERLPNHPEHFFRTIHGHGGAEMERGYIGNDKDVAAAKVLFPSFFIGVVLPAINFQAKLTIHESIKVAHAADVSLTLNVVPGQLQVVSGTRFTDGHRLGINGFNNHPDPAVFAPTEQFPQLRNTAFAQDYGRFQDAQDFDLRPAPGAMAQDVIEGQLALESVSYTAGNWSAVRRTDVRNLLGVKDPQSQFLRAAKACRLRLILGEVLIPGRGDSGGIDAP